MLIDILTTVIRTAAVYLLALLITRLIGRKLISQMTFFDFVIGASMGSIVATAMIGLVRSPLNAVVALVSVSLLTIVVSYIYIKSFRVRNIVNPKPVTLVDNGTLVEENMKKVRITINELMMMLREKNAFNLADVEFAIMETDGHLSVLPKADKKPLTPSHVNIQTVSTGLSRDIIIDGNLIEENLTSAGLDEKWLKSQLATHNIKDISEVFYAGMDNNKNLYFSMRNTKNKETHGKYEID